MTPSRQEAREAVKKCEWRVSQQNIHDQMAMEKVLSIARAYEKGELVERCDTMGKEKP